jgi:hypothetical protein
MPLFVEFPVVGDVDLGHHAQDAAAMDDDRRIEQSLPKTQRRAYQDGQQLPATLGDLGQREMHRVEHRALGMNHPRLGQNAAGIGGWICGTADDGAGGDPREAMGVERTKTHGGTLAACRIEVPKFFDPG